ncbi:thioredoxin [Corynebacterium bovis]|uniref:Thioredoxin n=3 Tax=Corynebacterium bovis TaxID=36808 RepID=A0A3R8RKN9_9CORY|nr:thioredoxin [Corynebacterium bovis]MBB3115915.1 thioredoxin 1 [Corynebacterium bovis DSM 20582 = CIP 54.80]MDK8511770.1 thioredoxin [Corynebacterium bovis]MDN8579800.1 thioredoxin [Corynebacterium bovis]QQC46876.1 thioredoxin [Corynebacterium bovis]RRO79248.1 thioredoxin [Corynebacterium bovis]
MSTTTVTGENFQQIIEAEGITLLDFWAEWCGPCKRFAPVFEKAAENHPDHTFGKIDTEENQDLAGALQIQSIPTLMIFRDGVLVFREAGALPAKALDDVIAQVEALDMEDVRRQIAEAEKNGGAES